MINRIKNYKQIYQVLALGIIAFVLLFSLKTTETTSFIKGDGQGYYAYLPYVFLYHNNYDDLEKAIAERYPNGYHDFINDVDGKKYNFTFVGLSILLLPFFFLAHIVTLVSGGVPDGYSYFYQVSVPLAAISYLLIGIYFLGEILSRFRLNKIIIAAIQVFSVVSTSILFYAIDGASYTHVYSFTAVVMLFYIFQKYLSNPKAKYIYLLGFIMGMIFLLRPINIIAVLFLLFFFNSFQDFWKRFVQLLNVHLLLALLIFSAMVFLQNIVYYFQINQFFIFAYKYAYFDFLDPQIINILFSYKKGLFVYTPILLLVIPAIVYLFFKNSYKAVISFLVLLFITYLLSSWWSWWYGMSYGQRAFIEFYPLFFIIIGFALSHTRYYIGFIALVFSISTTLLNVIQMTQYKHYIFYWEMDKEIYWKYFLKTHWKYNNQSWIEKSSSPSSVYTVSNRTASSLSYTYDFEKNFNTVIDRYVRDYGVGNGMNYKVADMGGSLFYKNRICKIFDNYQPIYIHINFDLLSLQPLQKASVYIEVRHLGSIIYSKNIDVLDQMTEDGWNHIDVTDEVADYYHKCDIIKITYYFNQSDSIYLDNYSLKFEQGH